LRHCFSSLDENRAEAASPRIARSLPTFVSPPGGVSALRLRDLGQVLELRLAAAVADRAAVQADRRQEYERACCQRRADAEDVADAAERRPAAGLPDRVRLARDRDHRGEVGSAAGRGTRAARG